MSAPADFIAWTQHTAQLLRQRRWDEIDMEQLIEEVEDLGRSERNSIINSKRKFLTKATMRKLPLATRSW